MDLDFRYSARHSETGQLMQGKVKAKNKQNAIEKLRKQNLIATKVSSASFDTSMLQRIRADDIMEFCKDMSFYMKAGVQLTEAIDSYSKSTENKRFRFILEDINIRLNEGSLLTESLKEHPKVFPKIMIWMLLVAEKRGSYESTFLDLYLYFKRNKELMKKIKGAVGYPLALIAFSIIILLFVTLFFIPTFMGNFEDLDIQLPTIPLMLIAVSENLGIVSLVLALTTILLVSIIVLIRKNKDIKLKLDGLLLSMPLIGKVLKELFESRFADVVSTLINSGISIEESLEIVQELIPNDAMKSTIHTSKTNLREGIPLSQSLYNSDYFSTKIATVTRIGEETGHLEEQFNILAQDFQESANERTQKMISRIQPILLVFLGAVIGFVAVGIFQTTYALFYSF